MNARNIEIEMGLAQTLLSTKRYLDAGGTSSDEFMFNLRSAIHYQLLEKAPEGIALDQKNKITTFSLPVERPYGSKNAQVDFGFSLHLESKRLLIEKMTMQLSSQPATPLVWTHGRDGKMPSADKAYTLIEGKKFQPRNYGAGRQIKSGRHNNQRKL